MEPTNLLCIRGQKPTGVLVSMVLTEADAASYSRRPYGVWLTGQETAQLSGWVWGLEVSQCHFQSCSREHTDPN